MYYLCQRTNSIIKKLLLLSACLISTINLYAGLTIENNLSSSVTLKYRVWNTLKPVLNNLHTREWIIKANGKETCGILIPDSIDPNEDYILGWLAIKPSTFQIYSYIINLDK